MERMVGTSGVNLMYGLNTIKPQEAEKLNG
jgi:hypothetical protein